MVLVRKQSEDGLSSQWDVPGWFVGLCTAISLGWLGWMSAATVWNTGKLQQGERFTASNGLALEVRLKALEKVTVPPPWFEARVHKLEKRVERNTDVIYEFLLELKAKKSTPFYDLTLRPQNKKEP